MKRWTIILSVITVMIVIGGCLKEDLVLEDNWYDYTRPLNTALPIFHSHFNTTDLLKQLNDSNAVSIDTTGLVFIQYKQPILAEWFDVVKIDKMELNIVHDLSSTMLKSTQAQPFNFEERIKINQLPEQRYDSIYLNDATLSTMVDWPEGFVGKYTVTFPDFIQNGIPMKYTSDPAADIDASDRLPNFWIYPQHSGDSSYFRILISGQVDPPSTIPTNTKLQVVIKFDKMVPEIVFGQFGTIPVFDKNMTMPFTFFDTYDLNEGIEFTGMSVNVNIDNYTGSPYSVTMLDPILKRNETDKQVEVSFLGDNTIYIDQPEYSTPIIPKNNFMVIDTTNSNIKDAFNLFPDQFDYHLVITSNPHNEKDLNFVQRKNKVDGYMELNLPFWFRITDLWRRDTIAFDIANIINDSANTKYVEELALLFKFDNGFPFELYSQGMLVNEDNEVIDSLFTSKKAIWETGKLDESDRVIQSTSTTVKLLFSGDQIKKYVDRGVKKIILRTETTTSHSGSRYVKLYDDYAIDIRFYFAIKSNLNQN